MKYIFNAIYFEERCVNKSDRMTCEKGILVYTISLWITYKGLVWQMCLENHE